jgi:hypothetical protein
MTTIAGASQYINSIKIGVRNTAPNILGGSDSVLGTVDILEVARSSSKIRGLGASDSARSLNKSLLSRTADTNKLLSLAAGNDSSVQGSEIIIKAIRSSLGLKSTTDVDPSAASADGVDITV